MPIVRTPCAPAGTLPAPTSASSSEPSKFVYLAELTETELFAAAPYTALPNSSIVLNGIPLQKCSARKSSM